MRHGSSILDWRDRRPWRRRGPGCCRIRGRCREATSCAFAGSFRGCWRVVLVPAMTRGPSGSPLGPAHQGQGKGPDLCSVRAGGMRRRGHRPEKMRMVSMPERRWACWLADVEALGVAGRDGIGVTDREWTVFSLTSFGSGGRQSARSRSGDETHFSRNRVSRTW